jgi:predicted cupin superfamily sugar epimerase
MVRELGLAAHPEGGWFRETYRSPERVPAASLPARFGGDRSMATSILFLLLEGERSRFHRLRADEVWCHHAGNAMRLHLLERGRARRLQVGGETPQALVPHGTWFAAELGDPTSMDLQGFSLASCFVSPGFEYADFELADREALLAEFPAERELILRFTKAPEGHP